MFTNIGGKLKGLAKVVCWLGIIASVIGGFAMMITGGNTYRGGEGLIVGGLLTLVFGSLFSWVGSLALYGFGELVFNSSVLVELAVKKVDQENKE